MSRTPREIRIDALKRVKEDLQKELSNVSTEKYGFIEDAELARFRYNAKIRKIEEEIEALEKAPADAEIDPIDFGYKFDKLELDREKNEIQEKNYTDRIAKMNAVIGTGGKTDALVKRKEALEKRLKKLKEKQTRVYGKQRKIAVRKIKRDYPLFNRIGNLQGKYDYADEEYKKAAEARDALRDGNLFDIWASFKYGVKAYHKKKKTERLHERIEKLNAKSIRIKEARKLGEYGLLGWLGLRRVTPVAPTPVTPTSPTPVTPTSPTPVTPTSPTPVTPTSPTPVTPTSPTPVTPTSPTPVTPTSPTPVTPTSPTPVTPTSPTPVTPTSPTPVTPTSPTPVTPTSPTPVPPTVPVILDPTKSSYSLDETLNYALNHVRSVLQSKFLGEGKAEFTRAEAEVLSTMLEFIINISPNIIPTRTGPSPKPPTR